MESGDIRLEDMVFDKVDVCEDYGNMEFSGVIWDYANISSESGDITLRNIRLME